MPDDAIDAARGMGLTERQLLWRVEVPLALPEILAGLRIATTTTVGLATLAFFAGAGGLGEEIYATSASSRTWPSRAAWRSCWRIVLDLIILGVQRVLTPWRRAAA